MVIPDKIQKSNSTGEVIVFNKFKYEKVPYYVLHSVFLHDHLKNISGEIDFLVIMPNQGIFCIEVKHGPVSRQNGQWKYKNSLSPRGPFQQANEAMHSIRSWILEKSGNRKSLHKVLFGTGVIFSGINTQIPFGTEGEQWQVLYRPDLTGSSISIYMDQLAKNWHNKHSGQNWYDKQKSRPSRADCDYLVKLLRGDFHRNYSALNEILDLKTSIESFTEQQLTLLDHVKFNDRSVIEGFAGTGKSVLATELFKHYLEKGSKVGFFCFNSLLGKVMQNKIEGFFSSDHLEGSYIGTFHSYMLSKTGLKVPRDKAELSEFFQNKLPMEFLLSIEEEAPKFDLLIVDEAQDLITEENLLIFDEILKKGLSQGRWIMAGDFYYQNIYQNEVNSLSILQEHAFFTRLKPLTVNCRNTTRISGQNKLLTGVQYEEDGNFQVEGEEVDLCFLDETELRIYLKDLLHDYKKRGIPITCISVLTDRKPTYNKERRLTLQQVYEEFRIKFSTIHAFKGLENDIVILLIGGGSFNKETLDLIYTGISRASIKLHLLLEKSMKQEYAHHIMKIYDKNKGTANIRA